MDAYLKQVVDYLSSQSWQIAILTVAVALITFLLSNKSAHVRYLLWLLVLAKCLVPPFCTIPLRVMPRDVLTVPVSALQAEEAGSEASTMSAADHDPRVSGATTGAAGIVNGSELTTSEFSPGGSEMQPSPAQVPREVSETKSLEVKKLTWADARFWAGITWLTGMCAYLAVNTSKALSTRRWLRRDRQPLEHNLQIKIEEFFSARDFRRLPKIWVLKDVSQPFVWGLLRGNIYLPVNLLREGSLERQKNVLGHELGHVVQLDAGVSLLQVIAQGIFWFHPFVWWANLRIRREREKCCDEMAVAGLNARPKDYSRAVVEALTLDHRSSRRVPSLAVVGPANNLEQRIRDILRPGRRFYKRPSFLAASAVLVIAAVTVPASIVPHYRAVAEIRIRPIVPRLEFQSDNAGQVPFYESFLDTHVAVIKSSDVLNRVLERPDVRQTDWYTEPHKSLKERLARQASTRVQRLKDALSVQRRSNTEIVVVSFSCTGARDAVVILNAVLEEYVAYVNNVSRVYNILVREHKRWQSEISVQEDICNKLREGLGTTDPLQLIAAGRARLDEALARLRRVEESIAALKLQINDPNSDTGNDVEADTPGSIEGKSDRYIADPEWQELNDRVRALRHQIAENTLSSKHPKSVRMQMYLEFAKESLRLREQKLDRNWLDQNERYVDTPAITPDAAADDSEGEALSLERRLALAKEAEKILRTEFERQMRMHRELIKRFQPSKIKMETNKLQRMRKMQNLVRKRLDERIAEHKVPAEVSVLSRASIVNEARQRSRAK